MNDQNRNERQNQNPSSNFFDAIMLTFEVLLQVIKVFFFAFKATFENLRGGQQERDVSNEIVLITGSGHGIGKELALQYSQLGSTIVCWDLNEDSNRNTVELIKSSGGKAHGYTVDVTNRERVLEVASKVLTEVGDVSILINNAGIMPQRLMLSHSADVIRKMYEINVLAHHWMYEAFLPKMMEKNRGHLVALSSIAGIIGFENIVPYCGAKFAVKGTMEALREELRKDGRYSNIKFTTVFPYMVDTGLCKVVKLRFQNFLKLLNPKDVATEIVLAQRKGILELTIPRYMYYLNAFMRNFPRESQDVLKDFFDSGIQAEC